MNRQILLLATALLGFTGTGARADCLLCTCTATTVPMAFGTYVPTAALPTDGNGVVKVRCSLLGIGLLPLLVSYDIGLSPGNSGSTALRNMTSGSTALAYNLYSDPARSQVWGELGSASQVTVSYGTELFGTWVPANIYGRIPARQTAEPGAYTDSIIVSILY